MNTTGNGTHSQDVSNDIHQGGKDRALPRCKGAGTSSGTVQPVVVAFAPSPKQKPASGFQATTFRRIASTRLDGLPP